MRRGLALALGLALSTGCHSFYSSSAGATTDPAMSDSSGNPDASLASSAPDLATGADLPAVVDMASPPPNDLATSIHAEVLTSGTTGTDVHGQSFNETRGIDVTVLAASDLALNAVTLRGLQSASQGVTVGVRVYASGTGMLRASADAVIDASGTATAPLTTTLQSGQSYRIAFFAMVGSADTFFQPGSVPYTSLSGALRINAGYSDSSDVYPNNQNIFFPLIELTVVGP
jgi:hypothetical protein